RLADELGFEAIWLAEHHFSSYGICPSLAVLAAAIARETRRARIGTSVVVAPFAHPLRIAEEWAMVDILSGGRLEFGLGRGYQPKEFHGFSISMEKTRERFDECLEVIRRAWTQERVTFEGEVYTARDLGVLPAQYKFYKRVRENLLSLSDEKALEQAAICGDPEEVADKIRQHYEALGVTYFMGSFNRGGIPHDRIVRSMRLFGEKVMPRFT